MDMIEQWPLNFWVGSHGWVGFHNGGHVGGPLPKF